MTTASSNSGGRVSRWYRRKTSIWPPFAPLSRASAAERGQFPRGSQSIRTGWSPLHRRALLVFGTPSCLPSVARNGVVAASKANPHSGGAPLVPVPTSFGQNHGKELVTEASLQPRPSLLVMAKALCARSRRRLRGGRDCWG